MEIFTTGKLKEVKISDIIKESNDRGKVIVDRVGDRGEGKTDLEKKAVALDSIELGPSVAAMIHGVPQSSASKYTDGKDIADPDTRAEVLNVKHNVQDQALTKLMDTLNLFDPKDLEKPKDIVNAASQLSNIVQKLTGDSKSGETNVSIHFYSPRQKKITDYPVIDVG
jgi:hypothetical protein